MLFPCTQQFRTVYLKQVNENEFKHKHDNNDHLVVAYSDLAGGMLLCVTKYQGSHSAGLFYGILKLVGHCENLAIK